MDGLKSPAYSKNTIEFVTVANEFCKFIENANKITLTEFIEMAHRLLPLVYLKGTLLPADIESNDEYNEKYVTEENYNYIQEMLLAKFGEHNFYDEIFDPIRQQNDEPAQLSIAETIADIYQDLKDFIMQFQVASEEIMINAIWECRQAFEQYWGQRIVNVLRVLHHLKYVVVDIEPNENNNQTSKDFDYNKVDTKNWLISRMQDEYDEE
jgi:hypothetical protein